MYKFSKKLKTFSFALMFVGLVGIVWGFMNAPSTIEEAKEIVAKNNSQDGHGSGHSEAVSTHKVVDSHGDDHSSTETAHGDEHSTSHDEHVFHQLQNRPWSALYVAIFFFKFVGAKVCFLIGN